DSTPEAKADHAHFAVTRWLLLQPFRRGNKVLGDLLRLPLRLHLPAALVIAGIAPKRRQRVRRKSEESFNRHAAGDIFDIRIQPSILVHDQHRWHLLFDPGWLYEIAAHLPPTFRRRILGVGSFDPLVVFRDLL